MMRLGVAWGAHGVPLDCQTPPALLTFWGDDGRSSKHVCYQKVYCSNPDFPDSPDRVPQPPLGPGPPLRHGSG